MVLALISLGIFELVSIGDIYEPYYFFIDSELHIVSFAVLYVGLALIILSNILSKKIKKIVFTVIVTIVCLTSLALLGKVNCEKIIYDEFNSSINSEYKYLVYEKGKGYDWHYVCFEFLDDNQAKVTTCGYVEDWAYSNQYTLYKGETVYHYEIDAPLFGLYGIYNENTKITFYEIDSDGNYNKESSGLQFAYEISNAGWEKTKLIKSNPKGVSKSP